MNEPAQGHQDDSQSVVDIAIVGAGMVGLPLAQALAARGWRVGLLDAGGESVVSASSPKDSDDTHGTSQTALEPDLWQDLSQRCSALNLGTQRWLAKQNLWNLVADDACAINRVNVSHKGYFGGVRLNADELHVPAVGYVVNNAEYVRRLAGNLTHTTVVHCHNAKVVAVEQHETSLTIRVDNAPSVRAKLLIATDGIGSVVRESAGIGTVQKDYDQVAVLGTLRLSTDHEGIAYERFTSSGPLALLPRPGSYMSFVDCIDPADQVEVERMSSDDYLSRLQSRFGYRLGRFSAVGPRFVTPLMRIEATSQTADRIVLLGNAARLLHPVGGQGYNLALRDASELVRLLDMQRVVDPGDVELLVRFVKNRAADQKNVVQLTDTLARSFRGSAKLPGHLRSAALLGLNWVTPLRRRFAHRTMGLGG